MTLLQASQQVPVFAADSSSGLLDHVKSEVMRALYEELDKRLAQTPGGVLLSPPQVAVTWDSDWVLQSGDYLTVRAWAQCEDLPLPPEYRLIGGPADGRVVRTQGQRLWFVPVMPPIPSAASYVDLATNSWPNLVAEYERQGDTAAYFYRRTYER